MGEKLESMKNIKSLGLPTVSFRGFSFGDSITKKGSKSILDWAQHLIDDPTGYGIFGVRTEPINDDDAIIGHYPHKYPVDNAKDALDFIRSTGPSLSYILNTGFPGEVCEFNAVVFMHELLGMRLFGEINYGTKMDLRRAMKDSKNMMNVQAVKNNDVAMIRSYLLSAGLVNGERVELSKMSNGRFVFWQILPPEKNIDIWKFTAWDC